MRLYISSYSSDCACFKCQYDITLDQAYSSHGEVEMFVRLEEILEICQATENSHFIWFARLLKRHLRGIYTFAKYGISTGKLEGINNKIKTERRKDYGYPDDE